MYNNIESLLNNIHLIDNTIFNKQRIILLFQLHMKEYLQHLDLTT